MFQVWKCHFGFKITLEKSKFHAILEGKTPIACLCQRRKSYLDILKLSMTNDIQILLSTSQRINHTFQLIGSVAQKVSSQRPKVTTSQKDKKWKMTVLKHHKTTLIKLTQDFRNSRIYIYTTYRSLLLWYNVAAFLFLLYFSFLWELDRRVPLKLRSCFP